MTLQNDSKTLSRHIPEFKSTTRTSLSWKRTSRRPQSSMEHLIHEKSNIFFFSFSTFRWDFNIFSQNCLRIHKRPRKLHHRSGSFVHFLGQMLNWKTKKTTKKMGPQNGTAKWDRIRGAKRVYIRYIYIYICIYSIYIYIYIAMHSYM